MALQGFEKLSDQVFVLEPPLANLSSNQVKNDPTTIVLFGWGDGLPKHLAKYSDRYQQTYSGARIVVVLSPISKAMFSTYAQRTRDMLPVVKAAIPGPKCAAQPGRENTNNRILLHCFSNTGGINLIATLNAYKEWRNGAEWTKEAMKDIPMPESKVLPHTLLVCDSTPGGYKFWENIWRWGHAMALGLSSLFPWPFVITKVICCGVLGINHFVTYLTGSLSIPEHSCRTLLDPDMCSIQASRLFITSKADEIIDWRHVLDNDALAKKKGFDVSTKVFEDSPHVSHMRMHPEEYWAEITRSWESAAEKDN